MTEQEQKAAEEAARKAAEGAAKAEQGKAAAEPEKTEHLIPKSRFDEVNEARKKAEEALAAREKADKEAEEKRLADQQQFRELAEKREAELKDLQAKLEADRKAAEDKAKKAEYEANVVSLAAKLNFADPKDAVRLLGEVEKPEEALKKLADEKPYLINKKMPPKLNGQRGSESVDETEEQRKSRLLG